MFSNWLSEWIVEPPVHHVEESACEGRKFRWWGGPLFAIGISEQDRIALGKSVLGGEGDVSHERDRRIFEAVAISSLSALAETMRQAIGSESPALESTAPPTIGESRTYHLACPESSWAIELAITPGAAIALRKHRAGRRTVPELTTLGAALADVEVDLGCHLGGASLSAGQLDDLAVGDLIVLDGRLKDTLPLTLGGEITRHGRAEIGVEGASHHLRITETPDLYL
ncbi:FliM/FliN family flagellar motor C-terminal domain-containing protein [Sphingomonas colocasiae]|uniref:FliM/FliN family flagellar motor switch protein n=1 Tax=Sphingomonas colocasiae TaxID=1848973 RepID=A0ABS7PW31_9SPHN|nr:flagellar motor switch protein FliM [Sphingomonas colocasiae]MBY8825564.1 FliM/FliN family flagellar motor switch protein [Sphingomonas colocasiae]